MSRLSTMVHQLCRMKGMKMKELAEAIGRSPATISQNLAKDKPRRKTFDNLAKVFGVEAQALEELYNNPGKYELNLVDGRIEIAPIGINYTIAINNDDVAIVRNAMSERASNRNEVCDTICRPKKEKAHTKQIVQALMEDKMDYIDEDTGSVYQLSSKEIISAAFNYKGTILYACTADDVKTVANIITSLATMTDKEQHDATLSLLIKQYGRW